MAVLPRVDLLHRFRERLEVQEKREQQDDRDRSFVPQQLQRVYLETGRKLHHEKSEMIMMMIIIINSQGMAAIAFAN